MTRVVFDTNTVISALLFGGTLSSLVPHWNSRVSIALISRATGGDFLRVLHYPKFGLSGARMCWSLETATYSTCAGKRDSWSKRRDSIGHVSSSRRPGV